VKKDLNIGHRAYALSDNPIWSNVPRTKSTLVITLMMQKALKICRDDYPRRQMSGFYEGICEWGTVLRFWSFWACDLWWYGYKFETKGNKQTNMRHEPNVAPIANYFLVIGYCTRFYHRLSTNRKPILYYHVCLSVYIWHECIVSKRLKLGSRGFYVKIAKYLTLSTVSLTSKFEGVSSIWGTSYRWG